MAVQHRSNSLKKLHEKQEREQEIQIEIGEIRDALVEIAGLVAVIPSDDVKAVIKGGDIDG